MQIKMIITMDATLNSNLTHRKVFLRLSGSAGSTAAVLFIKPMFTTLVYIIKI